jgi:hypothetical protein
MVTGSPVSSPAFLGALQQPGVPRHDAARCPEHRGHRQIRAARHHHAHRNRLSVRELLAAAYKQEANEKAALFRPGRCLATDNDLPELVGRLNGKDPVARLHIINILSKFPKPEVSCPAAATEGPQQTHSRGNPGGAGPHEWPVRHGTALQSAA